MSSWLPAPAVVTMYSSTAALPSMCGTGVLVEEIADAGGRVDQMKCSSVKTLAAASAMFFPCRVSCSMAARGAVGQERGGEVGHGEDDVSAGDGDVAAA
jgi:hypothetical protein